MLYHSGAHHIHVDIDKTSGQMLTTLDSRCTITILPEGSLPVFANIVLLARSTSYKLDGPWNRFTVVFSINNQMNVIGGNCIILNYQAISLLRLV
jgi:hypothetical protein